ncbi:MAG: tetratricopeptide repeat protein [Brasilonema angustatum HA4187-MV1]|jgi:tetratricopeptide (TPR) repeat protein|nr:tetratricopeptide repeat protein [Brasilonema angustatum HA4187-MV1]
MNRLNRCFRFTLEFGVAVVLAYFVLISPIHLSATASTQVTGDDFFKMGVKNVLNDNYQQAIKDFTQAIERQSSFGAAYSNRCFAYLQLEDYQKAVADCNQAIKNAPNGAEAYVNRGLAQYRQGNYPAAIADNSQAIALKPYDFRAYYNRGIANAMLGNHQQAIANYNSALSQISPYPSPLLADIYNDRGISRFQLQDFQAANHDFSLAIRLNPQDYRGYFNRGCISGKSGDNKSAIQDFTESLKLNPNDAHAYFNRGIAYHELGYEQTAIPDLQKAVKYFANLGQTTLYEKTLDLLKNLRQELLFLSEIALVSFW